MFSRFYSTWLAVQWRTCWAVDARAGRLSLPLFRRPELARCRGGVAGRSAAILTACPEMEPEPDELVVEEAKTAANLKMPPQMDDHGHTEHFIRPERLRGSMGREHSEYADPEPEVRCLETIRDHAYALLP